MTINIKILKAPSRRGSSSASQSSSSSAAVSVAVEPSTTLEQLYKEAAAKTRVRLMDGLTQLHD
jgi:hypothetical protein